MVFFSSSLPLPVLHFLFSVLHLCSIPHSPLCFCLYHSLPLLLFNTGQDLIQTKTVYFGENISSSSVLNLSAVAWSHVLVYWLGTSQIVCPIQLQLPFAVVPVMVLSLVLRPEIQIMCSTTAQHFENKKSISGDRENCLELVLHHLEIKQAHLISQYNSWEPGSPTR